MPRPNRQLVIRSDSAAAGWIKTWFKTAYYSDGRTAGSADKQESTRQLLGAYNKLRAEGVVGDMTRAVVIRKLLDLGEYSNAMAVKTDCESGGRHLCIHGYTTFLKFYAGKGNLKDVHRLWREVVELGLDWRTPHFFASFLKAYQKAGMMQHIDRLFRVALSYTNPDFKLVATYIGMQRTLREGEQICNEFKTLLSDAATKEALMLLCARLSTPSQKASTFFDPSLKSPYLWAHYLACHTTTDEITALLAKMKVSGVRILPGCYTHAIARSATDREAIRFYSEAYNASLANPGVTCLLLERLVNDFHNEKMAKLLVSRHPELRGVKRARQLVGKLEGC